MTTEQNKKIADFLGWSKHDSGKYLTPFKQNYINNNCEMSTTSIFKYDDLQFDDSWDWLIMAAMRIKELDEDEFFIIMDNMPDMETIYNEIVEFVDKWNEKNKITKV